MTDADPIAHVEFAGGAVRPVFEEGDRQYVIDDDRVYGVRFVQRGEADEPIVVDTRIGGIPF